MSSSKTILRVAIDTPVRRLFDYLPPDKTGAGDLRPGMRLRVPFGHKREQTGLLIQIADDSRIEAHKLKRVRAVLDDTAVLPPGILAMMLWAAEYYQHPVGEVVIGNMPALLAKGKPAVLPVEQYWQACITDKTTVDQLLSRAPKQQSLLELIRQYPAGISRAALQDHFSNLNTPLQALRDKGLIRPCPPTETTKVERVPTSLVLNDEQNAAVTAITSAAGSYTAFLLDGVTGSGKTEVYIHAIRERVEAGRQALVLVPEIGLTPQYIRRFRAQLGFDIAVYHSGLTDRQRLDAWLRLRDGEVHVLIGTRSAIWAPMARSGIIIVDEEHDLSYKQQEGFRYSARDLAVIRARRESVPLVLGSATPSLESIHNVNKQRYKKLQLRYRAANASLPKMHIQDIRAGQMDGALSQQLIETIHHYLQRRQQVLLFLNRRGYAPVIMCHDCGWICRCPRCEIPLNYHKSIGRLCCHHCQHRQARLHDCQQCQGKRMLEVGHGTQRLLETLEQHFPTATIARIDRDSTRRKGAMEALLEQAESGHTDILVGTQMTAKGHHFPGVTLVGVIDADRGLFSADFRSSERMAQLITQVSGRAGRADNPGLVMIQTHYPDHPLLTTLCRQDYMQTAALILDERKNADLPPYAFQVLLRAEANDRQRVEEFLAGARQVFPGQNTAIGIFGPYPAPIELRAGRHRMQLLLQSATRKALHACLGNWVERLEQLPGSKKVRWGLDVDPQDML